MAVANAISDIGISYQPFSLALFPSFPLLFFAFRIAFVPFKIKDYSCVIGRCYLVFSALAAFGTRSLQNSWLEV